MTISRISVLIMLIYLFLIFTLPSKVIGLESSILNINHDMEIKSIQNNIRSVPLIDQNNYSSKCLILENSSNVLINYQLGKFDEAESELRNLIRVYPMCADSRALLTAVLWHQGFTGEAKSNWAAVFGLDNRYSYKEWLLNIRHWPSKPTEDLLAFLDWIQK